MKETLADLYEWGERVAIETIDWYFVEKRRKARWSRMLRGFSAIFAATGSLVPVAALAAGRPEVGNWGFVLLALAAGCIGYDRYFGYSSAWLRYVSAGMDLRSKLDEYQTSWAHATVGMGNRTPSLKEVQKLVDMVRDFVARVHLVVWDETQSWRVEFHTNLTELESKVRPPVPHGPDGNIRQLDSLLNPENEQRGTVTPNGY